MVNKFLKKKFFLFFFFFFKKKKFLDIYKFYFNILKLHLSRSVLGVLKLNGTLYTVLSSASTAFLISSSVAIGGGGTFPL